MHKRVLVNAITFSRIPLALLLIVFFQADMTCLIVALGCLLAAWLTDIVDGFLARKFSVASLDGLLWDSLADKAIYTAAIIAMSANDVVNPLLAWALIFRDIFMYVSRIILHRKISHLNTLKALSRIHGGFMYLFIFSGFYTMFIFVQTGNYEFVVTTNVLGLVTLVIGTFNILKFFILEPISHSR